MFYNIEDRVYVRSNFYNIDCSRWPNNEGSWLEQVGMGRVVVGSNLGPGKVFQQLSLRYTLPTTSLVHSLELIIRETNFFCIYPCCTSGRCARFSNKKAHSHLKVEKILRVK